MARYLLTYDLHKERDYTKLFEAIKQEYPMCWHKPADVESVWLLSAPNGFAYKIKEKLSNFIDTDDSLLVVSLGDEIAGTNIKCNHELNDWWTRHP